MYKRPGKTFWYASFSHAEKNKSLGTADEERAREKFAQLIAERGSRAPLEADERSLADLWQMTRERASTNNTEKTAYEINLNLRRVVRWCEARGVYGSRTVDNKQLIEDYKTARRFDQVSAARINREIDSWVRMMKLAVELGAAHPRILSKPKDGGIFEKLREPRPAPHRKIHSKAQVQRLLRCIEHPGYRALCRSAVGCGLRDEELRHVEASDVRVHEVVVTPKVGWTTKSYRYRMVPISAATRKALLAWIEARDGGALNIDKKKVWEIIQEACKAAKVPPTSMHELRRAWGSQLYDAGVPLKTISAWFGHRDVATTERYLLVSTPNLPKGVHLPW